jgi:hypothetical protein
MKKKLDDNKPVTQKVLMDTLMDFWEQVMIPELDKKAGVKDLQRLETKMDNGFREVNRRLSDQEMDTPTKSEFNRLVRRVERIEKQMQN